MKLLPAFHIFLRKFVDCLSCKGQSADSKEKISQPHQEGIGSVTSLSSLSHRTSRVGVMQGKVAKQENLGKIMSNPLGISLAVSVCLKPSLNTETSCCGVASVCVSKFCPSPTIVAVSELPTLGRGLMVVSTGPSFLGAVQAQCWLEWASFTPGKRPAVCQYNLYHFGTLLCINLQICM